MCFLFYYFFFSLKGACGDGDDIPFQNQILTFKVELNTLKQMLKTLRRLHIVSMSIAFIGFTIAVVVVSYKIIRFIRNRWDVTHNQDRGDELRRARLRHAARNQRRDPPHRTHSMQTHSQARLVTSI